MPNESKAIPRVLICLAIGAAILTVALAPTPNRLPGVALGSPALLDLERAALVAALVLGGGGLMLELWRGARVISVGGGPLPAVDVQTAPAPTSSASPVPDEIYDRLDEPERRLAARYPGGENG